MKKIETMETYICDCCGDRLEDGNGYVGYVDADIWEQTEHGWIEHDGKHYCPNCYRIGDDDEIIIEKQ